MLLNAHALRQALQKGSMAIEPFDEQHFKNASYTFHLANRLFVFPGAQIIDPDRSGVVRNEILIPEEGYLLQPNEFVVGHLQEKLTLDASIAGFLSVRGSCAQAGLNALNSDFFEEPDWSGHLALAMKNVNNVPIRLRTGMKIVKGIFFSCK